MEEQFTEVLALEMASIEQALVDGPREVPIRQPLASSDPDILALYERFVIAREGLRTFTRCAVEENNAHWLRAGLRMEHLIISCQGLAEELR